jgi:alpha-ketoglutarate-dependent taurine dioxygenase
MTKDTQPAEATEYVNSSLRRATQGTPVENSGGGAKKNQKDHNSYAPQKQTQVGYM